MLRGANIDTGICNGNTRYTTFSTCRLLVEHFVGFNTAYTVVRAV